MRPMFTSEEALMLRSMAAKDEEQGTLTLPLELIREILLRLPVRSVLRFKCVCKSWLSLISDPQFGISHYDLAGSPTHRLLLASNVVYAQSIDIEAPLNIDSVPVRFLFPTLSPARNPLFQFLCNHQPQILGSCRGLILLYHEISADLILWNPTIRAHKRLSDFQVMLTKKFQYGFVYDEFKDDYLLVMITFQLFSDSLDECKPEIQVFSFKTNSRSRHDINVPYKHLGLEFGAGSFLNGALHWLVFCDDKKVPVIISFDLTQRSLSEIPLFDHFTRKKYQVYGLRVMGECLCVCCSDQRCAMTEIWVMEEYKVQSSWTRSIVILTNDIPHNLFSLICITKDGGILGSNMRGRLEKLNDKGELIEHSKFGRDQYNYRANLQVAMYRESLLPLPTVIGANRWR